MKSKLILKGKVLALLLALLSGLQALAYDFSQANSGVTLYYRIISGTNNVYVTYSSNTWSASYTATKIVIPSTVTYSGKQYTVTGLDENAFYGCTSLTAVTIPNTVTYIGRMCFEGCRSLTSISLPSNLTTIGNYAFMNCDLSTITIPESVTSIGEGAISWNINLATIYGKGATDDHLCLVFDGTLIGVAPNGPSQIRVPEGVTTIGSQVFDYYPYDDFPTTSVILPSTLTKIRSLAFERSNIQEIIALMPDPSKVVVEDVLIRSGVVKVPTASVNSYKNAYRWSSLTIEELSLTEDGVVYKGSTEVPGSMAITGFTSAIASSPSFRTEVYGIPVAEVANYALQNCTKITSISLPSSITRISYNAFYGCSNLSSITLPSSLTYIDCDAFDGTAYYNTSSKWTSNILYIGTYLIKSTSKSANVSIKAGTKFIASGAFSSSSNTTVTLPSSLTVISPYAFSHSKVRKVNFHDGITEIGERAFLNCADLGYDGSSLVLPRSLTKIGESAFYYCTRITEVVLPESLSYMEKDAFHDCTKLKSVKVTSYDPNSVSFTPGYNLYGFFGKSTTYPTDIVLKVPEGTRTGYLAHSIWGSFNDIVEYSLAETFLTFEYTDATNSAYKITGYTSDITSNVVLPSTYNGLPVTTISNDAFKNCTALKAIDIPSSMITIGSGAFVGCSNLASFTGQFASADNRCLILADGTMTAFAPASLTSYTVPSAVTKLAAHVFEGSSSLTSITLPAVSIIGTEAFKDCTALRTLTVKNASPSAVTLGTTVFKNVATSSSTLYVPRGASAAYKTADQWSDFASIKTVGLVELKDGTAYTGTTNNNDADVIYTRTFGNTNWQALYVPYNMSYEEWSPYVKVAELYNVRGYDTDGDGEINDVRIEFNTLNSGDLKPNIPYVVKAYEPGTYEFEGEGKILKAAPSTEGYVECSSTKYNYRFCGIYATKGNLNVPGLYYLSGGEFCYTSNSSYTLPPFRSYLMVTAKNGGYNDDGTTLKAPARISLEVDGEDVTGICDIIIETQDDGVYYDLMGRKVTDPTPGLYIKNGHKVYVK